MTDHADTIRDARERAQWWLDNEGDTRTISGRSMRMAEATLRLADTADALLAEREQLREALAWYADENHWTQPTSWGGRIWRVGR